MHTQRLPFLALLILGFLSANLGAQVPPKKFVFLATIRSDPPRAAQSSIFVAPAAVAIGPSPSPSGSGFAATIYVADPINNQVVAFPPSSSGIWLASTFSYRNLENQ